MPTEIERKFLVRKSDWDYFDKGKGSLYRQGYLLSEAGKTIRVRVTETEGFLTIKGKTTGFSKPEYEYAIPKNEAEELLHQFCSAVVSKIRYKVYFKGKLWEVDEFLGDNEGLLIAEIELTHEEESFDVPHWVEKEVTAEKRYSNSSLSRFPFKYWVGN
jgi:CYTH domain-containing protein